MKLYWSILTLVTSSSSTVDDFIIFFACSSTSLILEIHSPMFQPSPVTIYCCKGNFKIFGNLSVLFS